MCTARKLIEYLETLHPETQVDVLKFYEGHYQSGCGFVPLDLSTGVYYSSNTCDGRYPHGYLELGEE